MRIVAHGPHSRNDSPAPADSRSAEVTLPKLPADERFGSWIVNIGPEVVRDREARFFMARKAFIEKLNLQALEKFYITQHDLPRSCVKYIVLQALALLADRGEEAALRRANTMKFTSARIRKMVSEDGTTEYNLELKGKKNIWSAPSRPNIRLMIGYGTYMQLLPIAKRGSLRKTRYLVEGEVVRSKGTKTKCVAEVDVITHAGKPKRRYNYEPPALKRISPFVVAEVELPKIGMGRQLMRGQHSFEFLKSDTINLGKVDSETSRYLSTRYIARHGFNSKVEAAYAKLLLALENSSRQTREKRAKHPKAELVA